MLIDKGVVEHIFQGGGGRERGGIHNYIYVRAQKAETSKLPVFHEEVTPKEPKNSEWKKNMSPRNAVFVGC